MSRKDVIINSYICMSLKSFAFLQRFLKGFVAGGIVQAGVVISTGTTVHSVTDLKHFGIAIIAGFFVGGFLAVEKMLSWQK